jgi:hypothetical protein
MSAIIELLWVFAFVFAVHRFSSVAKMFAPVKPEDLSKQDFEVPTDLVAVSLQENEIWAQEEVMRVIRERYEELGDWNKVRAAMGIGRID